MKQCTNVTIISSFICLLAYLFICLFAPRAHAQSAISLGVYPPIIQINATPPASIKQQVNIKNLSNDPLDIDITVKPFTAANSYTGEVSFLGTNDTFQGEDPHIFEKMEILDGDQSISALTLAPGQEKTLTLHIALPKDEPPSDYYFSIIFASKANVPDQNSVSAITGGIATNVLLSVGPKGATTGLLKDFSAPLFFDHGPVPFSVLLQNTSTHFIVPRGFIIVKNLFGQAVGKVVFLPVNVLSKSNRYIPDNQSNNLRYAIWPEKFLLGPYSATVSITLSDAGPVFERTIYFFAMPFQVLIGLTVVILIGVIVVIRVRKKLR